MDVLDLDAKIELLMTLAGDDREASPSLSPALKALPPRLRNATGVGALRPLNLRTVKTGPAGRRTTLKSCGGPISGTSSTPRGWR